MLRVRIPLQLTGLTINNITGSQNSYPSDYVLASTTATVDASITEADLTITANDSFKFLNGTDPSDFAGVSYSGFVPGEDLSVLSGSVSLSRSAGEVATTYAITPDVSGVTAANYDIQTPVNGVFTIIPANELMVNLSDASTTYGDIVPAYGITSISYYDGSSHTDGYG